MKVRINNSDGNIYTDGPIQIEAGRTVRGWQGTMIDSELRYWHQLDDPKVLLALMTERSQRAADIEE